MQLGEPLLYIPLCLGWRQKNAVAPWRWEASAYGEEQHQHETSPSPDDALAMVLVSFSGKHYGVGHTILSAHLNATARCQAP